MKTSFIMFFKIFRKCIQLHPYQKCYKESKLGCLPEELLTFFENESSNIGRMFPEKGMISPIVKT